MSAFPAASYISDGARTQAEVKVALESFLAATKQLPGGSAEAALTIASGSITPTTASFNVETESSTASDNLDNIIQTNLPDGSIAILRGYDATHIVTVRHNQGGAGQVTLSDALPMVLDHASKSLVLMRSGTSWLEVGRFSSLGLLEHTVVKTTTYAATVADRGKMFLCTAGSAWAFTLPTAASCGAGFSLTVKKTDNNTNAITLTPAGAETIDGAATKALNDLNDCAIIVSDGSNWHAASTIVKTAASAGKILQVVSATYSTNVNNTSASLLDTGLTQTITPSSATSTILVLVTQPSYVSATGVQALGYVHLMYGAAEISKATLLLGGASGSLVLYDQIGFSFLHSPGTTSACVYKTQISAYSGSTVGTSPGNVIASIILIEVSA